MVHRGHVCDEWEPDIVWPDGVAKIVNLHHLLVGTVFFAVMYVSQVASVFARTAATAAISGVPLLYLPSEPQDSAYDGGDHDDKNHRYRAPLEHVVDSHICI